MIVGPLPPGSYRVSLLNDTHVPAESAAVSGGSSVDVHLRRPAPPEPAPATPPK